MAKKQIKTKAKTKPKVKSKPKAKSKSKSKSTATKKLFSKVRSGVSKAAKAARSAVKEKTKQIRNAVEPYLSKAKAPGYQWINSFLTVRDCSAAIDFYQRAFGFQLRMSIPGQDGKITHAEMTHNGSVIMMGPENEQMSAPKGSSPVILYTYVENVDELFKRATANGATPVQQPKDEFWGDRCCVLVDPQGHFWMMATHVKDFSPEDMKTN